MEIKQLWLVVCGDLSAIQELQKEDQNMPLLLQAIDYFSLNKVEIFGIVLEKQFKNSFEKKKL